MLHSGYEVEHFPYTLSSLLQVNYYDDYNFTTDTQLAFGLEKIGKVQYDSLYINHEALSLIHILWLCSYNFVYAVLGGNAMNL